MDNRHLICSDTELRRRLIRVALTILGSAVLAEETVQEAYLRLFEQEHNTIENPSAWLTRVTRNLALDTTRRSLREREIMLLLPGMDAYNALDERHAAESRLAELVSCLLHVSDYHVTAIVLLHVVFGMSFEDIANICGRSSAACRQAGRRALRRCVNVLDTNEPIDETGRTDLYVHAILEATTVPLMDSLSVTETVSMYSTFLSLSGHNHDTSASHSGRTRQVLVLTATGVQWALVLDGMVLCLLGSPVPALSMSVSTNQA